ncbi:MAG: EAL domain-containing protein [Ruminococcus sp.]|nr:EAL domain-containing protein [Ruminococcus sp.]
MSEVISDVGIAVTIAVFIILYQLVKNVIRSELAMLTAFLLSGMICFASLAVTSMIFYRYDMLTGVLKREGFRNNTLDIFVLRRQSNYSILFLNIKNFGMINQRYNYDMGDRVLALYAAYLKKQVKGKEFIAKYDNDNFVMLVRRGREQEIVDAVRNVSVTLPSEEQITLEAYVGVYQLKADDGFLDMEQKGQMALTAAREDASADIVWFGEEMAEKAAREKALLDAFRSGIEKRGFIVYYQPKVDLKTRRLCGAEALVRWEKDGRLISPGEFIPVFEKHGRITELDMYVFRQVCADIVRWTEMGITPVRISSNFSRLHLKNRSFADEVVRAIKESGISTEYVEMELTESSDYADFDLMKDLVRNMEKIGVHTSIDDFGTGYSSLSMLKELNVDVVKLDKTFADALTGGQEREKVFILDIISMVHKLGMTVLCEGVEDQAQIELLSKTDCGIIQGYYFDKPLTCEEFERRLRMPEYTE